MPGMGEMGPEELQGAAAHSNETLEAMSRFRQGMRGSKDMFVFSLGFGPYRCSQFVFFLFHFYM